MMLRGQMPTLSSRHSSPHLPSATLLKGWQACHLFGDSLARLGICLDLEGATRSSLLVLLTCRCGVAKVFARTSLQTAGLHNESAWADADLVIKAQLTTLAI